MLLVFKWSAMRPDMGLSILKARAKRKVPASMGTKKNPPEDEVDIGSGPVPHILKVLIQFPPKGGLQHIVVLGSALDRP